MELTNRENALIKFALNERLESNKKIIASFESLGVTVEIDEVLKHYLEENKEIADLLERFWNE